MNLRPTLPVPSLVLGLILLWTTHLTSKAQWATQSFTLKKGWNSIYLHVDLSHTTLHDLIDLDVDAHQRIEEIWLWDPKIGVAQFTDSFQTPSFSGSGWTSWKKNAPGPITLQTLYGNSACLIKVAATDPDTDFVWTVVGKPVPPQYSWNTKGLNFLGLPVLPVSPPSFSTYLEPSGILTQFSIYRYQPGSLTSDAPYSVEDFELEFPRRGEAVWLATGGETLNTYFGPIRVDLPDSQGIAFGDSGGQVRIRLRNNTTSNLSVTLSLVSSDPPPPNQPPILGLPPLLVRGERNLQDLTYSYSNLLLTPSVITLKGKTLVNGLAMENPDSQADVVLGLDRARMSGNPGDLFAAILRITDSLGHVQVDLPVSALLASTAGLWVGDATVTQVRHALKRFELNSDGTPQPSSSGQYTVTTVNTNLGSVPRSMPLRLLLHNASDGSGAQLLQRVFYGIAPGGQKVLATQESLLDSQQLESARRISAAHLPWTLSNEPWPMTGSIQQGSSLSASILIPHDAQVSNPFLHTYHPDHNNLDASSGQPLPTGQESYGIIRSITLTPETPPDDFVSLTTGSGRLFGSYSEVLSLSGKDNPARTYEVRGHFTLTRISSIATLTKP